MTRRVSDGGCAHPSATQRNRQARVQTICRLISRGYTKRDCLQYAETKWNISRATASAYVNDALHLTARGRRRPA